MSVLLPAVSDLEPASRKWQDSCRALLALYCDLPENRRGRFAMKMTRLRNEIMKDFDIFENGKRIQDRSLGREDLEHWMKGKNYLSMRKFQYVDRYVLKVATSGRYDFLFEDLIAIKEAEHRRTLTEVYAKNHRDVDDASIKMFRAFSSKLLLSDVLQVPHASKAPMYSRLGWISDFKQVALYVRDLGRRSASITVAYLDKPLSDLNKKPDFRDFTICFGYITVAGADEYLPMLNAVLHVIRGEFPGDWQAGNSVSSVEMHWEGQTFTGWVPQVCTQNISTETSLPGEYRPISQLPSTRFKFTPSDHFVEVADYLRTLTNRYVIW